MEMEFLRVLECTSIDEYNALAQYKLENEYKILKVINVIRQENKYLVFYTELGQIINFNSGTTTINGTPVITN